MSTTQTRRLTTTQWSHDLTLGFLVMGETPVALDCFLRTKLWFIYEDMAGHGRDPFVLRARRGGKKGEGGRGRGRGRGREGRGEKERGEKGRKGERRREDLISIHQRVVNG